MPYRRRDHLLPTGCFPLVNFSFITSPAKL